MILGNGLKMPRRKKWEIKYRRLEEGRNAPGVEIRDVVYHVRLVFVATEPDVERFLPQVADVPGNYDVTLEDLGEVDEKKRWEAELELAEEELKQLKQREVAVTGRITRIKSNLPVFVEPKDAEE